MILAGIGKRIPRTDHVGIANDDEISKVNHLFNDTTLHLHASPIHMSGQPAATYVGSYVHMYILVGLACIF